jgi:hypothetical protein
MAWGHVHGIFDLEEPSGGVRLPTRDQHGKNLPGSTGAALLYVTTLSDEGSHSRLPANEAAAVFFMTSYMSGYRGNIELDRAVPVDCKSALDVVQSNLRSVLRFSK